MYTISVQQSTLVNLDDLDTKIDGILIHAYWFSQNSDSSIGLSSRGNLVTAAAAQLIINNVCNYIVLAGGHIWGPQFPSLAMVMQQELVEKFHIPKDRIIVEDSAMDTNDEIDIFLEIAKKFKWNRIGSLASTKHFMTIPKIYSYKHQHAVFLSTENVLGKFGTLEQKRELSRLGNSLYELNYFLYQLIIKIIFFFDPSYTFLHHYAKKSRDKKQSYGLPFLPADRYTL